MTIPRWTPRFVTVALVTLAAAVAVAGPAFAHVGIEVNENRPGARARYTVTVPNESETADTVQIEIQLPDDLDILRHRPPPGWDMADEDGVLTISGGALPPGATQEFRFVAVNPRQAGDVAFPSLQTYSDGEVVRWTGEPDSDQPAPVVTYEGPPATEPTTPPEQAAPGPSPEPEPEPTEEAAATETEASPAPTATPTAVPTGTPPAEDAESAGVPWLLIALAVAVVAALGAAAVWRRRPDTDS